MKKLVLQKNPPAANRIDSLGHASEQNSECLFLFFFHGTEFRAFLSSAERFGTEFREFSVPRNGSERNSESCFYFSSMVQNSEHSSPMWNGSERNSEIFLFRGTAGIPPEQTNCSVYSVFGGIIFCRKLPTLPHTHF
jgi:hypothetical protein